MKNKKLNTLLGPFVILIWIGVLMRFMGGCEDHSKPVQMGSSELVENTEPAWDSFSLHLSYRDPFLNQLPGREKTVQKVAVKSVGKLTKKPPKKKINIPKLRYQGGVIASDSTAMTGILLIGGQVRTVRPGEQIGHIKIETLGLEQLSLIIEDSLITLYK